MTTQTSGILISLAALWMAATSQAAVAATPASDLASATQARVIVKLRRSVVMTSEPAQTPGAAATVRERITRIGRKAGVSVDDSRQIGTWMHVARVRGMASSELARRLALQPEVEYAVEDQRRHATQVVPNDPLFPGNLTTTTPAVGQWYLRAPDVTMPSALNAPGAWAVTTGNSNIVVAVLDTGVRYDHPDLQNKLLPGYNMISDGAIAGNGVGRTNDASDLGDWVTSQEIAANAGIFRNCTPQSTSSWHGTQVAGSSVPAPTTPWAWPAWAGASGSCRFGCWANAGVMTRTSLPGCTGRLAFRSRGACQPPPCAGPQPQSGRSRNVLSGLCGRDQHPGHPEKRRGRGLCRQ